MAEQAIAPAQAEDQKTRYNNFIDRTSTTVIAALPIAVPDADLKRARAQFRVAFGADSQLALMECTPESIARCLVLSAISGLMPGGPRPDVWLIPRRNKHKGNQLEANWQMSFRGYIRLARRAGWELEPVLVFEGEKFVVREGLQTEIEHERILDLPQTWNTLKAGYIRIFPSGQREQAKLLYLSKEQIKQRRGKAQDQSVWNEWPLEMALKTLCNYAGNREAFPCDDPARYAMQHSEMAEIGAGGATSGENWGSLGPGSKTARLAQRLSAPAAGAVIEVPTSSGESPEGMPIGVDKASSDEGSFTPPAPKPGEPLSPSQLKEVVALAERMHISIDDLEGEFGGRLDKVVISGMDSRELEAEITATIRRWAERSRAEADPEPNGSPGLFGEEGKKRGR